jgi:hypothetical protein
MLRDRSIRIAFCAVAAFEALLVAAVMGLMRFGD